jgi:uncharacterized protein with HEPN domain
MPVSLDERLTHILDAIADMREFMAQKTPASLTSERVTRAAFERFVEIMSEASRHIPKKDQAQHAQIAWHDIANIGNRIRHGYDAVDERVLWDIYAFEIDGLEAAVAAIRAQGRHP